jgi:hypothetical protein
MFEMVPALRQHDGRAFRFECLEHIVEDQIVARLILGEGRIDSRHGRALRGSQRRRQLESCRPIPGPMRDAALGGLDARLDTVADRAALHKDDGMMTILAGDLADSPRTNRAFARLATNSKLAAERWWHSSTIR